MKPPLERIGSAPGGARLAANQDLTRRAFVTPVLRFWESASKCALPDEAGAPREDPSSARAVLRRLEAARPRVFRAGLAALLNDPTQYLAGLAAVHLGPFGGVEQRIVSHAYRSLRPQLGFLLRQYRELGRLFAELRDGPQPGRRLPPESFDFNSTIAAVALLAERGGLSRELVDRAPYLLSFAAPSGRT